MHVLAASVGLLVFTLAVVCGDMLSMRPNFVNSVCGGTSWTHKLSCMVCHYRKVQPIQRCCLDRLSAAVCRRHIGHFTGRPVGENSQVMDNDAAQSGAWDPRSKLEDPAQVHNRRYPSIFLKTSWGPGVKRGLKRGGGSYHFFQPALWVKSSSWPPQSHKKARRWASLPEPAIDMPQVLLERTDN